ncbi:MAG TPA: class I SAM-dependent methyltransferase, partial [Candidatus Hydrogenedentes bacterium]|nr:class I SAM-dependent methyltransferase [Candidatus Hydrogenedentota bacterium]
MQAEEYAMMFEVEDTHWWYRGLRAMIAAQWHRCAPPGRLLVLDAGCGTGANLEAVRESARGAGIDVSRDAVRFCRQRDMKTTAVASTLCLPFAAKRFDVVLSMDVIQHRRVPVPGVALSEMHRVLKPGGLLFVNVPAYQWLHSSHDVAVEQDKRFRRGELIELLGAAGFVPLYATYWNTLL